MYQALLLNSCYHAVSLSVSASSSIWSSLPPCVSTKTSRLKSPRMDTACTAQTRFVLLLGSCSSTWRAKIFAPTTFNSSWCAAVLHSQEVSLINLQADKETDDDLVPRSCRYTQYSNISNGSPHRVHPISSLLPLLLVTLLKKCVL